MEALVPSYPFLWTPSRLVPRRLLAISLATASALTGLAATAFSPAAAEAALISSGACNGAALSQPFLRWGDSNSYELVPGGNFEGSLSGWTLSGGAQRVP